LFFFFILSKGYQTCPDSGSYISNSISRTPLYPLLLDLFQYLFGESRYLHIIPIFQALFGLLSCFFLANILEKRFGVGAGIKYIIFLILLYPQFRFASCILTESVTYSLFLLTIAFWTKHIFEKRDREIYLTILFMFLSILARPQLYFILPVLFLYSLFSSEIKKGLVLIGILIAGIFVNDALQKTYNYIYHTRYVLSQFGGFSFLPINLYLSKPGDIYLFSDKKEKEFFERIYRAMDEGKMLHKYGWKTHGGLESAHFLTFFNPILGSATTIIDDLYKNEKSNSEIDKWIKLNRFCSNISKRLFINNYKKFLKFSVRSIYEVAGFFIFLPICLLVFGILGFLKKRGSLSLFSCVISLLSLFNYFLLLLSQPLWMMRYRFYTDIMIVVVFVILPFREIKGEKDG
jgi:uncharacterized membrane protein (UPF0136 family)